MMENEVLGYKSPLYGRRTGQWKVEALRFKDLRSFFPEYSVEEQIRAYSILGGIPFYLQQFDDSKDVSTNIFAECKWQNKKVGIKVYDELKEESGLVKWNTEEGKEYFALFSKVGFTPGLKNEKVLLFDLEDIDNAPDDISPINI